MSRRRRGIQSSDDSDIEKLDPSPSSTIRLPTPTPIIISQLTNNTNSNSATNKRKLELTNDSIGNINNNSEPKKKRKLNQTNNKKTKPIQYIQQLIKERNNYKKSSDHYKNGMNLYKADRNHWKTKYIQLHSQIMDANNKINGCNTNTTKPKLTSSISPLPTPLPTPHSACLNTNTNNSLNTNNNPSNIRNKKRTRKTTVIKHNKSDVNINMTIRSHSPSQLVPNIALNKNKNKKNKNKNTECKYDTVTARLFEMGFDMDNITDTLKLYHKSGKDIETVFNKALNTLVINENKPKLNDNRNYNKKVIKRNYNKRKTDSMNKNENDNINKPYKRRKKKKDKNKNNKKDNEFENSYCVSIDCYICKEHFNDFDEYCKHIKGHYKNESKRWRICDKCPSLIFNDDNTFVGHIIHKHKNQKPFKCSQCNVMCSTKIIMSTHWRSEHKKKSNRSSVVINKV